MPRASWRLSPSQAAVGQQLLNQSIASSRQDNDGIQLPALGTNAVVKALSVRMLCARQWVNNEIIDFCATYFAQRAANPVVVARSDHYNRLITTQDLLQQPRLGLQYFGIPDSTITLDHEIIVPIQLPGHWAAVIIQPRLQRFVFYDGFGGNPETVVPIISTWLNLLYTTEGLTPATPVNTWPIVCPTDAPKQGDGYNCGPNSLMFIYMWLVHRRFPTLLDWNVAGPNRDQEATRLFLCYHLLTQGGLLLSPRWISEPWGPDPITPSQVLSRIRQRRTIFSHRAETRAIGAQGPRDPNPDYVVLDHEPRTKAAVPEPSQSSHAVFDNG